MSNTESDAELSIDSTGGTTTGPFAFDGIIGDEILPAANAGPVATEDVLADALPVLPSQVVSHFPPDGLILSTGNLYFTHHDAASASVWRTSQTAIPGQEILLYSEPGARFGDIVFAQVDGVFFGYFFAGQGPEGVPITIKRVPLTGGVATVLTSLEPFGNNVDIANSHRNLITDGEHLYWQDDRFIRKMPIRGGGVTAIDEVRPNTPTAGLALLNGNIFYASVRDIRSVPVGGTNIPPSARTIATADDRVLTLQPVSNGVFWGEPGAIRRKIGSTTTTVGLSSGFPTSIAVRGSTLAWTDCIGTVCRLIIDDPSQGLAIPIGDSPLGVTITPSRLVFWGDTFGVRRRAF